MAIIHACDECSDVLPAGAERCSEHPDATISSYLVPTSPHQVRWADGRVDDFETYAEAVAAVERKYPASEIGHDGDLASGGDRTLCWPDEDASMGPHGNGDDGQAAIASIWKV